MRIRYISLHPPRWEAKHLLPRDLIVGIQSNFVRPKSHLFGNELVLSRLVDTIEEAAGRAVNRSGAGGDPGGASFPRALAPYPSNALSFGK